MTIFKMPEKEIGPYLNELEKKVSEHWLNTVEQTAFMQDLVSGKLDMETLQLFYTNWGAFVPVINSFVHGAVSQPPFLLRFQR
jgi:hypothetical protein